MASAKDAKDIEVEKLRVNAWNPNSMPKAEYERLVQEIKEVGFIDFPQVIPMKDGTYTIIGGEHRITAAKELGFKTVPCIVLKGQNWTDEDLQKFVTVRLNMIKGKIDPGRMAALYDEMIKKYSKEALQGLFAYTDSGAWNRMLDAIGKAVKQAGVGKDGEFQKRAKDAKTIQDLEAILNEMFANYGDTVDLSFMVFTFGRREHIYIQMDKNTHAAMKKVMKHCTQSGKDINELVSVAMTELAKALKIKSKSEETGASQDDTAF